MSLLALAAIALTQTTTLNAPDFSQLWVFATVERRPSFETTTRVRIGTFEGPEVDASVTYWFVREREDDEQNVVDRAATSSKDCPAAVPALRRLESLELPHPDVPGYERDFDIIVTDGVHYSLQGVSRHPDGQPGDYSLESNTRTPLARWTDSLFRALDECWTPLPKS